MRELPQQLISLIHFVELNNAGWWEQTTDRCILSVLWFIKTTAPVSKIRKEVEKALGIDLKSGEVKLSLERLIISGQVITLPDGNYQLTQSCLDSLNLQVQKSQILENTVKEQFAKKINEICPEIDTEKIWQSFLKKILIPFVSDQGAKIYGFLFSTSPKNQQFLALSEEFLSELPVNDVEELRVAVYDFIDPCDENVKKYIYSYLDGYFIVSSSGLSKKVAQKISELRTKPAEFEVFVDTNFVFSLLGLHDNPSNEAVADLIEMVQSLDEGVNVRFVINPITLDETRNSIKNKKQDLSINRGDYPANLSEAAKSVVSGLEGSFFHEASKPNGISNPEDYFSIYENNIIRLLEDKKISLFTDGNMQKYLNLPDVEEDVLNRVEYERKRYGNNAKSEIKIKNDILLWHYVKDLREDKNALPIDSKYWIVTLDHRLVSFDRNKSSQSSISPVCLLPTQLLQILRFFTPQQAEFEEIILNTMRFPLVVNDYNPRAEAVAVKIIKKLAFYEGIDNVSVETLHKIITDEGLRENFQNGTLSDEEQSELIKDHLTNAIVDMQRKLEVAEQKLDAKTIDSQKLLKELEERQKASDEESELLKKQISNLKDKIDKQAQERINEKREIERKNSIKEYINLIIFTVLPYPFVLGLITYLWAKYVPDQSSKVVYVVSSVVILISALLLINTLLKQGKRNEFIADEPWFINIEKKWSIKALILAGLAFFWALLGAFVKDVVMEWLLTLVR